ncbi:hypothetical protein SAMN03159293_02729 [Pseudomonas sp. NFACC39-1]|nr:hypothetical protein SAMN03159293_02729 [Pseudomonas sp. NFACC39-1]SFG69060.1 hypothetical protein SAMN03159297_00910 [Pseudomonas sp. NFACC45]
MEITSVVNVHRLFDTRLFDTTPPAPPYGDDLEYAVFLTAH